MKKKVLLMGASGSGKTSMRSLIFSNNPASLTARLGATIDVEQNHVRFLGDLILNLWDCGGQDAFMDSYLSTQRSTIFSHVGVLIYVFDVESRDRQKDLEYYRDCLDALRKFSPDACVFLLVHKMDLVRDRNVELERRRRELVKESTGIVVTVFGTSIYDESLYKAWSRIVHTLIPNAAVLSRHLTTLAEACSATEVILFERTTFLVIATSTAATPTEAAALSSIASLPPLPSPPKSPPRNSGSSPIKSPTSPTSEETHDPEPEPEHEDTESDPHQMNPTRYERTSELIKAFKYSCSRFIRQDFHALEMELAEFTAVLDELTKNTYVMIVVHDPTIETAALKLNIRLARRKFEELQGDSLISS